jgi:hypothetical protein
VAPTTSFALRDGVREWRRKSGTTEECQNQAFHGAASLMFCGQRLVYARDLEFDSRQRNFVNCMAADMSALGQKRTLRLASPMSALPPKADIGGQYLDCPLCAKSCREQMQQNSAMKTSLFDHLVGARQQYCGTERPSAVAVLRLRTSSYFVGA